MEDAIRDPNVQLHVNTKGTGGFANAAQAGLSGDGGATDIEMGWIARSVANGERDWSSVTFYRPGAGGGLEPFDVPEPDWSTFGRLRPFIGDANPVCGC